MQAGSRASLAASKERLDGILASASAGGVETLTEQLFAVTHLLAGQPRLRRALTDTSASAEQKAALADRLFGTQLAQGARDVVTTLVTSRWSSGSDLVQAADTLAVLALLAVAERAGAADEVEDELFRFTRVLDGQPQLRAALIDPRLPAERKVAVLDALLGGKAQVTTIRLISEAVLFPRGRTLDEALDEYADLAAVRRDRLSAFVRTAVPLTAEQTARLGDILARQHGRPVQLHIEVDPRVVGGFNIQVGEEVVDATISRRLGDARRRFAG